MSLLVSLLVATAATPSHPQRPQPRIAVLDVQDLTGRRAATAKLSTDLEVSEVGGWHRFDVISSFEIGQLLGLEKEKRLLGCAGDSGCLAEIGGALGVDYLVTARLGKLGTRVRLDLRLLDARRARMLASAGVFVRDDGDALADATTRGVRQLFVDAGLLTGPPRKGPPGPAGTGLSPSVLRPVHPVRARVPAELVLGLAGALALATVAMTLVTRSAFADVHASNQTVLSDARLADGLAAGAVVAAGVGVWLWFRAAPRSGSGGEVGAGGRL